MRIINLFKRLFTTTIFIMGAIISYASNYYVDNVNGNDSNNGFTTFSAWKSINKVNSFSFSKGDSILFKRGGVWRGQILPKSGTSEGNITYTAYDTGAKPLFLGSVNIKNINLWVNEGNNIWRTNQTFSIDVGNIIFNNDSICGVKKWTAAQLLKQGDFWWDKTSSKTLEFTQLLIQHYIIQTLKLH